MKYSFPIKNSIVNERFLLSKTDFFNKFYAILRKSFPFGPKTRNIFITLKELKEITSLH